MTRAAWPSSPTPISPSPSRPVNHARWPDWSKAPGLMESRLLSLAGSAPQEDLEALVADHRSHPIARIGASDSHFGWHDLARVVTVFPGGGAEGFRAAILAGQTEPHIVRDRPIPGSLIRRQKFRSLVELPLRRLAGRLG
jgi:hypothetical protein